MTVTDAIPAGTSLVSATLSAGGCLDDGSIVTCDLGVLADGASETIDIVVQVDVGEFDLSNVATVSGPYIDLDPSSDSATETTEVVARRVRVQVPAGFVPTLQDQGSDDFLDSDVSRVTAISDNFGPALSVDDSARWGVGLRRTGICIAPDEPVFIADMRIVGTATVLSTGRCPIRKFRCRHFLSLRVKIDQGL